MGEELLYFNTRSLFFSFLQLSVTRKVLIAFIKGKVMALAFKSIRLDDGNLPILISMSEIARKIAVIK
ncbi:MAG: hypothetical protein ACTSUN_09425 [Promethearchaeota archaeon]